MFNNNRFFSGAQNTINNWFKPIQKTISDWSSGQYHFPGYNYLGPGTSVIEKIEQNEKPINKTDTSAMHHDLDYLNIGQSNLSNEEKKRKIRESDKRFIKELESNDETDLWGNIAGRIGIGSKILLEDLGVLDPLRWL